MKLTTSAIRRFTTFVVALLTFSAAFMPSPVFATATAASYPAALAACQSLAATPSFKNANPSCPLAPASQTGTGPNAACAVDLLYGSSTPQALYQYWIFPCNTAPNGCTAGQALANGASYNQSSTTGEAESGGCCLALTLGGPLSGQMVQTGMTCSAATGAPQVTTPPSETNNPNGSKTICDPVSGDCVTYTPSPDPAPATSSPNSATNSQTNTGPSTSNSTGTTTPASSSSSGSGSGAGSGTSGSGSGATTTTTQTNNPATASSTSCTTGVCDVGNADGQVGALYTASTDTPNSVYASFQAQVSNSPIVSAATGFFSLSVSDTCPIFSVPGNKYFGSGGLSFGFFCQSNVLTLFQLAGFFVLAVAAYAAFKIAIY